MKGKDLPSRHPLQLLVEGCCCCCLRVEMLKFPRLRPHHRPHDLQGPRQNTHHWSHSSRSPASTRRAWTHRFCRPKSCSSTLSVTRSLWSSAHRLHASGNPFGTSFLHQSPSTAWVTLFAAHCKLSSRDGEAQGTDTCPPAKHLAFGDIISCCWSVE